MTDDPRRLGDLLRNAADDVVALVRGEASLARSEASDAMHQVLVAVVSLLSGALIAFAALLVLLEALVQAMSNYMWDWVASIVVAVVVAIVAFFLIRKGEKDLSAPQLAPTRTAENLRRDANLVKEQVS